jgi:hypothetical protein
MVANSPVCPFHEPTWSTLTVAALDAGVERDTATTAHNTMVAATATAALRGARRIDNMAPPPEGRSGEVIHARRTGCGLDGTVSLVAPACPRIGPSRTIADTDISSARWC